MIAVEKVYLYRMKKSMTKEEKLFFLNYLNMRDFDARADTAAGRKQSEEDIQQHTGNAHLIETYIPHKRDESLQEDEYYVLTANGTVQKGVVRDLAFNARGEDLFRLWNGRGVIHCWASDNMGYVTKRHLYDNKQDCKDNTHFAYDDWERLRALQIQE